MSHNLPLYEVPLHEARNASDLIPLEQYSARLPEREQKPSRLHHIFDNRIVQALCGTLLAFGFIIGAGFLGLFIGKQGNYHMLPATPMNITITPAASTLELTQTVNITVATTTMKLYTTLWFKEGPGTTNNPTTTVTVLGTPEPEDSGMQKPADPEFWETHAGSHITTMVAS